MTGMISAREGAPDAKRAKRNFARLMEHVANLYCAGGTSSVSAFEARELALSVAYALGVANAAPERFARVLDVVDPVSLWHEALGALDARTDAVCRLWREAVATMPPLRNVALRDTLVSLGDVKRRYDRHFAAHEVPCDIDYPLSEPVDDRILGIDYVEAWLSRLLVEVRWIARFDVESCAAVLERVCPDYRGLHVNLYELLVPHEGELEPVRPE